MKADNFLPAKYYYYKNYPIDTIGLYITAPHEIKQSNLLFDNRYPKRLKLAYLKRYTSNRFYIRLSVASFIYGDNITVPNRTDIDTFIQNLIIFFSEFEIYVTPSDILISQVDLFYDLAVENSTEILRLLQKCDYVARFKRHIYPNPPMSVYFEARAYKIKFYDKKSEIAYRQTKHKELSEAEYDVLQSPNDLLRLEFSFSRKRMSTQIREALSGNKLTLELLPAIYSFFCLRYCLKMLDDFLKYNPYIFALPETDSLLAKKKIRLKDCAMLEYFDNHEQALSENFSHSELKYQRQKFKKLLPELANNQPTLLQAVIEKFKEKIND